MFVAQVADKARHRGPSEHIYHSPLMQDFYKYPMTHFIRTYYPGKRVTFKLTIRSKDFPVAKIIPEECIRREFDHARTVSYGVSDLYYIDGVNIGNRHMFGDDGKFRAFLEGLRLPPYTLERIGDSYEMTFSGTWEEATWWEMAAMAIINELKSNVIAEHMSKVECDIYYGQASTLLYHDLMTLRDTTSITVTNFGLRRHESTEWEEYASLMAMDVLAKRFVGISNVYLAQKLQMEPKGTNAHELYMAVVALASALSDEAMREAPYTVMRQWEALFGSMLILLPDCYGTQWLLDNMPQDLAEHVAQKWAGFRWDSGGMITEGERQLAFYKEYGVDPLKEGKIGIASDGLTINAMQEIDARFKNRLVVTAGWGTHLTHGHFEHCHPRGDEEAVIYGVRTGVKWSQICGGKSMVIKLDEIEGLKAVKISNNPEKMTGDRTVGERYLRVYGTAGHVAETPVV